MSLPELSQVTKLSFRPEVYIADTEPSQVSEIVRGLIAGMYLDTAKRCREEGLLPLWQTLQIKQDPHTGLSGLALHHDRHTVQFSVMTVPWVYHDEAPGGVNPPALGRDTVETPSQKD